MYFFKISSIADIRIPVFSLAKKSVVS